MDKIKSLLNEENPNIIQKWIDRNLKLENTGVLFEFIDIINGNDSRENIIWHYTKRKVFEKIFPPIESEEYKESKGNISIRLSNVNDTNDPLEALVFKPFLIKNKDRILNILKENKSCKSLQKDFAELIKSKKNEGKRIESYIFSMTRLKDSHVFWNKAYAKPNGFAIGFEKGTLKDLLPKGGILDVVYIEHNTNTEIVEEDLINTASALIRQSYDIYTNEKIFKATSSRDYTALSFSTDLYSSIFKHRSWKNERETRIILSEIKGREISPKIESINGKDQKVHYEFLNKDVVDSIMLGPKCSDEQVKAVKDYLVKNGYSGISVERSHAFDFMH
jgi:hypothetical protein